jgi:hypothetical protein
VANKAHVCFEVHVNGKRACVAGIGELGVLSALLTWVKRSPTRRPKGLAKRTWCKEELTLGVGGITTYEETESSERVEWLGQDLAVGDEIRIVITTRGKHDPPRTRKRIEANGQVPRERRGR